MMNLTKVIFKKNGARYICKTEEQLKSFLSSGWELAPAEQPKKPTKKTEAAKK